VEISMGKQCSNKLDKYYSVVEKQFIFLRRNWDLIDIIKQTRNRVAILTATMLLGITGFAMKEGFLRDSVHRWGTFSVIIVLTIASLGILFSFNRQYNYRFILIKYLYEKVGFLGPEYRLPDLEVKDAGNQINFWVSIMVALLGCVCGASILLG